MSALIALGVEVMIIKEVMTRTSLKFYKSDVIKDVSQLFLNQEVEAGIVCDHNDNVIGVFTKLEILTGLHNESKELKDIILTDFKILHETDDVMDVDFGEGLCNPVQNQKGQITGYITKENFHYSYAKDAQIRLKHFDAIFNSAHNGILSIDSFGKITSINPPAVKMAKTTREKALGKFLTDVVLPSGLLEVVRTGKGHTEKYKAGKRTYITNRSPIIENEQVVGAVGVFQDISEIEFISNELETVKQLVNELDTIINTSTNGICIVKDEKVMKVNNQFKKMFQMAENLPEHQVRIPQEINEVIQAVWERKQSHSLLHKGAKTSNSLIISGTPLFDKEQQIHTVVVNVKDMTEMERLRDELARAKEALSSLHTSQENNFIYQSETMTHLIETVKQVASVDVTVLITGESGVGKGEIANLIRIFSPRKDKPFVRVNCGAIPESLIESELFGYVPGAFTGASKKGKKGYFEQADQGTIFLDEIGELPQNVQVKLLTVLQDKEITRIGAENPQQVDIRIIAATNKDLKALVAEGLFREDLYYRLNVMPIYAPPLREREEDIPSMVEYYTGFFNEKYNKSLFFTEDAIRAFSEYHWPGNVRELVNIIERAFVTATTSTIEYKDVLNLLQINRIEGSADSNLHVNKVIPLKDAIEELEKQLITKALRKGKSYRQAAKLLDVNVSTVSRKMKKYEKEIE